jgi:hypothetical protein
MASPIVSEFLGTTRIVLLGDLVNAKVLEDVLCGRWGWMAITTS